MSEHTLALPLSRRALNKLEVTEQRLDAAFRNQVIPSAVEEMIAVHCFKSNHAAEHRDCLTFWNELPAETRQYDFFCLGKPYVCVNCGSTIGSLVGTNGIDLLRGRCPGCREPVAELGMEQARWWEILHQAAGEIIATYDVKTNEVVSGLIFRLADFMLRSGTEATMGGLQGMEDTARRVYLALLSYFPGRSSWCSYASRWAVYGRTGAQALGLALPLSTTAKCEFMPSIEEAAKRVVNGQSVPDMSQELAAPGEMRDRAKAVRRRLQETEHDDPIPSWERPTAPDLPRIPAVQFKDGDDQVLPYLLLIVNPAQYVALAEFIEVIGVEIGPEIRQWLEETAQVCAS